MICEYFYFSLETLEEIRELMEDETSMDSCKYKDDQVSCISEYERLRNARISENMVPPHYLISLLHAMEVFVFLMH